MPGGVAGVRPKRSPPMPIRVHILQERVTTVFSRHHQHVENDHRRQAQDHRPDADRPENVLDGKTLDGKTLDGKALRFR